MQKHGFDFKRTSQSVSNVKNLCAALEISSAELDAAISLDQEDRYERTTVAKSDGSERYVHKPHYSVRLVQRRINKRFFSNKHFIAWPDFIFGSIPNMETLDGEVSHRDHIACAKVHCESKSALKLDIKNFFDNISSDIVYGIFSELLKFPDEVSLCLTNVCTYKSHLVQGALTSSYLASLCLWDVESKVVQRLRSKGLAYTRFVDDITISSKSSSYDFSHAQQVVTQMLLNKDLPINHSKTKIYSLASEPYLIHGLRVCFKEPRLPASEVGRIRASVKNVERIANETNYRMSHAYRHDFNRCMGRVNKLARVKHNQHGKLVSRLNAVYPLPSKKDIERCTTIVERLEKDYALKHQTYWYSKRFYLAHERLNILKRTYIATAKTLRARLKLIQPSYS